MSAVSDADQTVSRAPARTIGERCAGNAVSAAASPMSAISRAMIRHRLRAATKRVEQRRRRASFIALFAVAASTAVILLFAKAASTFLICAAVSVFIVIVDALYLARLDRENAKLYRQLMELES